MTALCYFNALRELGGARRIVEDEVRDRAARYGSERRRVDPQDQPFADRIIKEPMEITSRVSTDDVAQAKQRLDARNECDRAGLCRLSTTTTNSARVTWGAVSLSTSSHLPPIDGA
jgi:hypothetical protein